MMETLRSWVTPVAIAVVTYLVLEGATWLHPSFGYFVSGIIIGGGAMFLAAHPEKEGDE